MKRVLFSLVAATLAVAGCKSQSPAASKVQSSADEATDEAKTQVKAQLNELVVQCGKAADTLLARVPAAGGDAAPADANGMGLTDDVDQINPDDVDGTVNLNDLEGYRSLVTEGQKTLDAIAQPEAGLRLADPTAEQLRQQLADLRSLISRLETAVDQLDADQDRRVGFTANTLQSRCEGAGGRFTSGWCQCGNEMGGRAEFMDFFECRRRVGNAPFNAVSGDNTVRFQSDCRRAGGTVDRDLCRCGRDYVISVSTWSGAYLAQNDGEGFVRNCGGYTRQNTFAPTQGQGQGRLQTVSGINKKCTCGVDSMNTSCLVARYDAQNPNGTAVAWMPLSAGSTCGTTNSITDKCNGPLRSNLEECLRR